MTPSEGSHLLFATSPGTHQRLAIDRPCVVSWRLPSGPAQTHAPKSVDIATGNVTQRAALERVQNSLRQ